MLGARSDNGYEAVDYKEKQKMNICVFCDFGMV